MCVQKWSNVGGERLEWGRSERRRDGSVVGEIRWSFPFDLSVYEIYRSEICTVNVIFLKN